MKRRKNSVVGTVLIGAWFAVVPLHASADPQIQSMAFLNVGNDCVGVFGANPNDPDAKPNGKPYTGFSACWVQATVENQLEYFSPSIIKFDWSSSGLEVDEISTRYPTVNGGEFVFVTIATNGVSGNWRYNPSPEPDLDPEILYWTAKAGDGFTLFWLGESSNITSAVPASQGVWQTPELKELSHLTFYNSGGKIAPPPDPPAVIPEPGTLLLLGGAFAALGLRRRLRG